MEGNWGNLIYTTILLCFLIYGLASNKTLKTKDTLRYTLYWLTITLTLIIAYSYRYEFKSFTDRISGEINPSSARLGADGSIAINSSKGGHFYLNLQINGKNVRLLVDTGATDLTLSIADAKRVGINISDLVFDQIYHTANGISYGASTRLKNIRLADLEFMNVKAAVNQGEMSNSLLGINFLKKFRKYEFTNNKLILTP